MVESYVSEVNIIIKSVACDACFNVHAGESIGLNVNFPGVKRVVSITFRALLTFGDGSSDVLSQK